MNHNVNIHWIIQFYGHALVLGFCDPDAATWKLAVLPWAPLQNPFANSLQTSDAASINSTKSKTRESLLFPNALFDKWKQGTDFDPLIGDAKRSMTRFNSGH